MYMYLYFNLKAYYEINKYSCAASLMITCQSILLNLIYLTFSSCINAPWAQILGCRGFVAIYKPTSNTKGCFSFSFFLIEVQLIYSVVLVSGIQQSDSVMHTYIYIYSFSYSSIMVYYRILNIVPRAIQQDPSYLFYFFIDLFIFIYLFIFGCVGSSLLHMGFLQLRRAGATLHCGARASHCGGFSCCGAQALGAWASVVVAHRLSNCGSRALERRLSSCGAQAQLICSMWDLPGPGLEPVSPALAVGFFTTAPPGKPLSILYVVVCIC